MRGDALIEWQMYHVDKRLLLDPKERKKREQRTAMLRDARVLDRIQLRSVATNHGHKLGRFIGTRSAKCKRCGLMQNNNVMQMGRCLGS